MRNIVAIRVKANAHFTCQECGSTELIQVHHEIPGDDNSLIALCAECHSKKHPDVPMALFFSTNHQPYWHNKSASSLAKELGVHSRTVIRAAKRLEISPGELSQWDEELIKNNIPKLNRKPEDKTIKKDRKAINRPASRTLKVREIPTEIKITTSDLFSVSNAAKELGRPRITIYRWIEAGKIVGIKLGGILFIPKEEIARLKNEKATEPVKIQ